MHKYTEYLLANPTHRSVAFFENQLASNKAWNLILHDVVKDPHGFTTANHASRSLSHILGGVCYLAVVAHKYELNRYVGLELQMFFVDDLPDLQKNLIVPFMQAHVRRRSN